MNVGNIGSMLEQETEGVVLGREISKKYCVDFDEDCVDVPDEFWCRLYDLTTGKCPYLKHRFL